MLFSVRLHCQEPAEELFWMCLFSKQDGLLVPISCHIPPEDTIALSPSLLKSQLKKQSSFLVDPIQKQIFPMQKARRGRRDHFLGD